jgi:hypothetical protein
LQGMPTPNWKRKPTSTRSGSFILSFTLIKTAAQSGKYLHRHLGNHICYESKRERHERKLKS